jgi:hypothetical protein
LVEFTNTATKVNQLEKTWLFSLSTLPSALNHFCLSPPSLLKLRLTNIQQTQHYAHIRHTYYPRKENIRQTECSL